MQPDVVVWWPKAQQMANNITTKCSSLVERGHGGRLLKHVFVFNSNNGVLENKGM